MKNIFKSGKSIKQDALKDFSEAQRVYRQFAADKRIPFFLIEMVAEIAGGYAGLLGPDAQKQWDEVIRNTYIIRA